MKLKREGKVTFRLNSEERKKLDQYITDHGIKSTSYFIRMLLDDGLSLDPLLNLSVDRPLPLTP